MKTVRLLNWIKCHENTPLDHEIWNIFTNSVLFLDEILSPENALEANYITKNGDIYKLTERGELCWNNNFPFFREHFHKMLEEELFSVLSTSNILDYSVSSSFVIPNNYVVADIRNSIFGEKYFYGPFFNFVHLIRALDEIEITQNCIDDKINTKINNLKTKFEKISKTVAAAFDIRIQMYEALIEKYSSDKMKAQAEEKVRLIWISELLRRVWEIGEILDKMEHHGFKIPLETRDPKSLSLSKKLELI